MKATLQIHNARFYTHIGVLPEEKVLGNLYIVDLTAVYDATRAIEGDDMTQGVSYADLYDTVRDVMENRPGYSLLERVAAETLSAIHSRYPLVEECTISIRKSVPPIDGVMEGTSVSLTQRFV